MNTDWAAVDPGLFPFVGVLLGGHPGHQQASSDLPPSKLIVVLSFAICGLK